MDPKNWALTAISSSNPPKRKNEYKYHKSQATGTYIYIVDSGIQSDDREFEGRVVHGYGYADPYDLQSATNGGDLSHGTFVAGIAGGVRHGVAKNTYYLGGCENWGRFLPGARAVGLQSR